jgi:hypothetical protein
MEGTNKIKSVQIRIGYQERGTYEAGTPKTLKEYTLTASGIRLWTFTNHTNFVPEHCIEGVDILDNELGIQFDVPEIVKLACQEITVDGPRLIETVTKPWVSKRETFFESNLDMIPSPADWINWLREEGLDVVWRFGGSEAQPLDKVPYPDYSGWFLQLRERISQSEFGVFIRHLALKNGILRLGIQMYDPDSLQLWYAVNKTLSKLPQTTVRSGNCTFSGQEWNTCLVDGSMPTRYNGS